MTGLRKIEVVDCGVFAQKPIEQFAGRILQFGDQEFEVVAAEWAGAPNMVRLHLWPRDIWPEFG